MPVQTRIEDDIKLLIEFQADEAEFNEWASKLRTQYLKNVEVPGFRKGKAPEHLAVKQINPQALEQTILQEAVDRYGQEAIAAATAEMKEAGKVIIPGSFIIDPASLKREKGLAFTVKGEVLPEIKLDPEKIEVTQPTEADLPERISFEEFLRTQKNGFIASYAEYEASDAAIADLFKFNVDTTGTVNGETVSELSATGMQGTLGVKQFLPDFEAGITGLKEGDEKEFPVTFPENYKAEKLRDQTASFKVKVNSVQAPKSTEFGEVSNNQNPQTQGQQKFESEEAFDTYVRNYYDQETKQLLEQQRQRRTIQAILEQVPDFPLDEERIKTEVARIYGVIEKNATSQNVSVGEVFAGSGIPGAEENVQDAEEVKKKIEIYVRNEFKLSTIWDYIYETKIEQKISPEQIEQGSKEVLANPARFNLNKEVTPEQARNYAYSNLKKNTAAKWLFAKMARVLTKKEEASQDGAKKTSAPKKSSKAKPQKDDSKTSSKKSKDK